MNNRDRFQQRLAAMPALDLPPAVFPIVPPPPQSPVRYEDQFPGGVEINQDAAVDLDADGDVVMRDAPGAHDHARLVPNGGRFNN